MVQDEHLKHTHELFAAVGDEAYPETDISAEQWLHNKGASGKVLAIADACYANDFGCNLHQLGLREMITENRRWDSGVLSKQMICELGFEAIDKFLICNSEVADMIACETKGLTIIHPKSKQLPGLLTYAMVGSLSKHVDELKAAAC